MTDCVECVFKGVGPYEAITTNNYMPVCGHHRLPYKLTCLNAAQNATHEVTCVAESPHAQFAPLMLVEAAFHFSPRFIIAHFVADW